MTCQSAKAIENSSDSRSNSETINWNFLVNRREGYILQDIGDQVIRDSGKPGLASMQDIFTGSFDLGLVTNKDFLLRKPQNN